MRWSAASFSCAEGGAHAGRRVREFCADELLAFARAFRLPLWFFLLPPPGERLAGAGEDLDGLEPRAALEAVLGSAEGWREYEERLLSEKRLPPGPQPPVEPWLLERVRVAAERGPGSRASAADA